jgi:hypothetical protein
VAFKCWIVSEFIFPMQWTTISDCVLSVVKSSWETGNGFVAILNRDYTPRLQAPTHPFSWLALILSGSFAKVINTDKSACGDQFSFFLEEVEKHVNGAVAFQRVGQLRFVSIAGEVAIGLPFLNDLRVQAFPQ